jgi:hypothetical protein
MARTFREVWRWLVPRWLGVPDDTEDEGARVNHTIALVMDATLERARQGLDARFPSRTGESANQLTAADRGLLRGRSEALAAFAARLKAWRTPRTHRVRGSAIELLTQVWHYWGGVRALTIDARGRRYLITVGGVASKDALSAWDWDSADAEYSAADEARFWIDVSTHPLGVVATPDLGDPALWGGAVGTAGYTLGQVGATLADVLAMRNLFAHYAWHPEHTRPEWLILRIGATTGAPTPDGTWRHWSLNVLGTQTPTRASSYRYWSLTPAENNTYAGNVTSFCVDTLMPDASTYGGDPTNANAWDVTSLPSGDAYTGDPGNFPTSMLLLDDGSTP